MYVDLPTVSESSAASSEVLKVTADIQSSSRRLDVLKAGYSADRSVLKDLLAQFAALKDITREVGTLQPIKHVSASHRRIARRSVAWRSRSWWRC